MNLKQFASDNKSLIGLLILMLLVSLVSPSFLSVDNLFNILRQTSINGIIAMGMTFVILTAGIDLSVGSVLALTGAVCASLISADVSLPLAHYWVPQMARLSVFLVCNPSLPLLWA